MEATGPLFENDDWTLTADGLEHKATRYAIDRDQLGRRRDDGFWAWPLHMLEKSWVVPESFAEAFCTAARFFGLSADGTLAGTFAEAGWVRTASGWHRPTAEIVPHPALLVSDDAGTPAGDRSAERRRRLG